MTQVSCLFLSVAAACSRDGSADPWLVVWPFTLMHASVGSLVHLFLQSISDVALRSDARIHWFIQSVSQSVMWAFILLHASIGSFIGLHAFIQSASHSVQLVIQFISSHSLVLCFIHSFIHSLIHPVHLISFILILQMTQARRGSTGS